MIRECPRCKEPVLRLEQVEGRLVGRCGRCDASIPFESPRERPMKEARSWPEPSVRRIDAPEGWEVVQIGEVARRGGARIGHGARGVWLERTWRRPRWWPALALAIVGVVLAIVGVERLAEWDWRRRDGGYVRNFRPTDRVSISGGGLGVLLVGLPLAYASLAFLLNRTRIVAKEGRLTIRHRPLPWRGVRDVAASDVEQIFCDEVVRSPQHYRVLARVRGVSAPLLLVEGLPTWREALFVESRLELTLGIPDRRVDGELLEKRIVG